jgi:tRNA(fMet)-specific endonuclease VapC
LNYLLDTNICIYYLKGLYQLDEKFNSLPDGSLYISEITLAELKYGIANSSEPKKNRATLENFLSEVRILPIIDSLDIYAQEKVRLRKLGRPVDDFDLLIGASAIANSLVLVTNNEKHFDRIKGIEIENWTI